VAYLLDLFSPETYEAFSNSKQDVSGFRIRHKNAASRVHKGDHLLCYMTKISRWCGILEVLDDNYIDETPIFYSEEDPFILRFHVKPLVWLPKEYAIPIKEPHIWNTLSITKAYDPKTSFWTGRFRSSLTAIPDHDALFLEQELLKQAKDLQLFPIDDREYSKMRLHRLTRDNREVVVSLPSNQSENQDMPQQELRESLRIQALLVDIGTEMGYQIWLPRNDRKSVVANLKTKNATVVDKLPLSFGNELTTQTIEQIDVLWLKGRSIVRAFEVEHTTSIYSGILRMADLIALQPNLDINLHIVAPLARREKVFQELRRPAFSLFDNRRPLYDQCTYLSYESVEELSKERHLKYMQDAVLEEYAEEAE
jgi:hypothetical protein